MVFLSSSSSTVLTTSSLNSAHLIADDRISVQVVPVKEREPYPYKRLPVSRHKNFAYELPISKSTGSVNIRERRCHMSLPIYTFASVPNGLSASILFASSSKVLSPLVQTICTGVPPISIMKLIRPSRRSGSPTRANLFPCTYGWESIIASTALPLSSSISWGTALPVTLLISRKSCLCPLCR